jgi:NodT family efflux transporter outer membrane factor (OMF) lipoprotein
MPSLPQAQPSSLPVVSRRAVALGLGGLAAGCAQRIEPAASGLRLPAAFVAANGAGPGAATPHWPDPAWWERFGSPELNALMRAAMAGNLDIAAAVAQLRQADAQVRIAGAALLPTVQADLDVLRQRNNSRSLGTAGEGVNSFAAFLFASYEIDFWGRNRALLEAARSSATAARYVVGVTTISTQAAVANALFNVLGAEAQLEIQRGNLEVATRNLNILRQRLAVGTSTGLDVAQQETVVAQQRAAMPELRQRADQNRFALATLTGVTPDAIAIRGMRLEDLVVPEVTPGLPAELLARRPDVQLAEADLQAANADIAAARAALYPTISLTARGGVQSNALEALLRPGSVLYTLASGITAPIFNAGALRAQVEVFEGRQQQLLANYRRAILAALQDTETSLAALARDRESVELQRARLAAAQRAYDIAEAQLRIGTVDLLTVLNVQTSLFSARLALTLALLARLQSAAALFTALGGGWAFASPPATPSPGGGPLAAGGATPTP